MSITHSILSALNLKDPHLHFSEDCVSSQSIRGVDSLVFSGSLSYDPPSSCPLCGSSNPGSAIIKHGTKSSLITLPSVSRCPAYLRLKKQRFLCKHCGHTFTASTSIVPPHCFISNNTRLSIVLDAKMKTSEKDIAFRHSVSHATVNSLLQQLYQDFKVQRNFLPPHLCFDEFRSVKGVDASMSFLFLNAESGQILNILPDRRMPALIRYFMSYSRKAREAVKTVCMDMYSPYFSVVHHCFPHAKIILDRFHIVQLLSRALNKTRVNFMNQSKPHYNKLKRYWKLLLKFEDDLNDQDFKKWVCFPSLMREIDIVHFLVELDPELKATYELYQSLLTTLNRKDPDAFLQACLNPDPLISKPMNTAIQSLVERKEAVINALTYSFSNGMFEGTNNLIKVIKRLAFGYRSFIQFKTRILLISNTLVPCRFLN